MKVFIRPYLYYSWPSEDDKFFYFGRSWTASVWLLDKSKRVNIYGFRWTLGPFHIGFRLNGFDWLTNKGDNLKNCNSHIECWNDRQSLKEARHHIHKLLEAATWFFEGPYGSSPDPKSLTKAREFYKKTWPQQINKTSEWKGKYYMSDLGLFLFLSVFIFSVSSCIVAGEYFEHRENIHTMECKKWTQQW